MNQPSQPFPRSEPRRISLPELQVTQESGQPAVLATYADSTQYLCRHLRTKESLLLQIVG